jgi:hypothetical protein
MTHIGGSGCIPQSWISLSIRQLGQVCSMERLRPKRKKGVDLINLSSLLHQNPWNAQHQVRILPQIWGKLRTVGLARSMITPIQAERLLQLAALIDNGFPLWSLNSTLE